MKPKPGRNMEYYDTIARNQTVMPLGDHMLSLGGQYRFEELKDQGNKLAGNKLDRYSWALFAEDDWALTNDFTLTGGLRMDKDENFGTHWTPRVYGVWHLDESWTVKVACPPVTVHLICAGNGILGTGDRRRQPERCYFR